MTETPKCPYCGEEMIPMSGTVIDRIRAATFMCSNGDCRATSPKVEKIGTKKQVIQYARAAALSRAEPENRVLTLEELAGMANKYDWELAWMECRNIKSEKLFLTQKCLGIAGEHGVWFVTPGKADDIFYAANRYNKTWRCWLRKPTEGEMAAEKWEE